MSHDELRSTDRRTFLRAEALATASALGASLGVNAQEAAPMAMELPKRPLGKTGIEITILDQGKLTRFLTYHEHHGDRAEARRLYAELPAEARDWSRADLEAARAACPNRLDFARLLPEVDRHLA